MKQTPYRLLLHNYIWDQWFGWHNEIVSLYESPTLTDKQHPVKGALSCAPDRHPTGKLRVRVGLRVHGRKEHLDRLVGQLLSPRPDGQGKRRAFSSRLTDRTRTCSMSHMRLPGMRAGRTKGGDTIARPDHPGGETGGTAQEGVQAAGNHLLRCIPALSGQHSSGTPKQTIMATTTILRTDACRASRSS